MIYLVTGGSGSGKSAFAEELVEKLSGKHRYYIATMKPFGEESLRKIQRHRKMRQARNFTTLECYTGLGKEEILPDSVVLLECMSNLVANEMFDPEGAKEHAVPAMLEGVKKLARKAQHLVIVTNEVFSDGILYGEEMEQYLSNLGIMNQELAKIANQVIEVVYSIPVYYKKEEY